MVLIGLSREGFLLLVGLRRSRCEATHRGSRARVVCIPARAMDGRFYSTVVTALAVGVLRHICQLLLLVGHLSIVGRGFASCRGSVPAVDARADTFEVLTVLGSAILGSLALIKY